MAGLAAALLLAELAVRLTLDPAGRALATSRERLPRWSALLEAGLFEHSPNPDLHYTLRPGFRGVVEGIDYTIDARGLRVAGEARDEGEARGDHNDASQHEPTRRLVLLGDSNAFGLGARAAETLSAQLERELARRGLPTRVDNLGVPAYHTGQETAWLAELAPALAAERPIDGVLLWYYANDASEPGYHLDEQTGHLYTDETSVPYAWKRLLRRSALYQVWAARATRAYEHSGAMTPGEGVTWPTVEARLDELLGLCEEHGWPLFVLNLPMVRPGDVVLSPAFEPDREDAARVSGWARRRDVPELNLGPWLERLAQEGRLDGFLVSAEPGNFYDDHFTGEGLAALAHEWVGALVATKLFDFE